MDQPRVAFTVYIYNKPYDVWNLSKEHQGWNDTIKTWWLYYSERLPEGIAPPEDSEHFVPWSVGILRQVWDIRIMQKNTTKTKWDDLDFRNHTTVEMWCNGKLIYEFGTGGKFLDFAFAKIQYMQVMLSEHPYDFFHPEKNEGRKIFWYGLPATVRVKSCGWEIGVVPDYSGGISKEDWWKEYKNRKSKIGYRSEEDKFFDEYDDDEEDRDEYINWGDAFSDKHIDWFRQDPPDHSKSQGAAVGIDPSFS